MEADCKHILFFSTPAGGEAVLLEAIAEIRQDIEATLAGAGFDASVWMGLRTVLPATDYNHRGTLITRNEENDRWRAALVISFPSGRQLARWYEDQRHSDLRERVYRLLSAKAASLYDSLGRRPAHDGGGAGWDRIEEEMKDRIWRLDFLELRG
jgi:hypothetical protein